MMIRKKSNPWARAKYLYVLPLAAVTVAAFARPEISKPLDEIQVSKLMIYRQFWKRMPIKMCRTLPKRLN